MQLEELTKHIPCLVALPTSEGVELHTINDEDDIRAIRRRYQGHDVGNSFDVFKSPAGSLIEHPLLTLLGGALAPKQPSLAQELATLVNGINKAVEIKIKIGEDL
jgi:hypothetical protein